jgi:hypothetical protein
MMTDISKDSTKHCECEKSIPTALDRENISHLDDAANQIAVETPHTTNKLKITCVKKVFVQNVCSFFGHLEVT